MPTMEATYGVVVGNRFGALTEDFEDDPLEQLKILEEAAKKKKVKQDDVKESKSSSKGDKDKSVKQTKAKDTPKTPKSESTGTASQPKVSAKSSVPPSPEQQAVADEVISRKPAPRTERGPRALKEPRDENEKRPPPRSLPNREVEKTSEVTERSDSGRSDGNFNRPAGMSSQRTENFNQGGGGGFGAPGRPPRGRGGGRGTVRGGKRNFDRHSGSDKTGVKPVEKRDGGGARNWGSVKDDMEEHLEQADETPNTTINADDTENQDPNPETSTSTAEVTEEPIVTEKPPEKLMTLDEWKAMQSKEVVQPTYDIRKPDDEQWDKGYYALPKKTQLDRFAHGENELDVHKGRHKELVDIKITFSEPTQRGGRRGSGRPPGGGRGRGVGFYRGGARRDHRAPDTFDVERDFPTLGGKS